MSEQVNKEQTKGAEQENITELTDQQLAKAQGGADTAILLRQDGDPKIPPAEELDTEGDGSEAISWGARYLNGGAFDQT